MKVGVCLTDSEGMPGEDKRGQSGIVGARYVLIVLQHAFDFRL
jgi:hypothetical protein